MSIYITDTHPLIWYASGKHSRLSKKVLRVFEEADQGRIFINVPAIVLLEIALLIKVGKITLKEPSSVWIEQLLAQPGFDLAPMDSQVVIEAYSCPLMDPFDSVITSTAKVMDYQLITKDAEISASQLVDIYW